MRAIDDDLEAVQAHLIGQRGLDRVDIATARILDPAGAPDRLGRGELRIARFEHRLDLHLVLVGELEAIGPEQLYAIILERVVASRDHHAEVRAHRSGEQCYRRGRHRAHQHHVHADAGKARDQRVFHHVTRKPGILADDDAVLVAAAQEMRARGLAYRHRHGCGHETLIGASPDTVGAEKLACHA